jgi:hypothetical protein
MLKKLGRRAALSLFSFLLVAFLLVSSFLATARPDKIKSWLTKSGLYQAIPGTVTTHLAKDQKSDAATASDDISFSDPAVQSAIKKTLTPGFLQSSANAIIDGTYHWLNGRTPKPDFSINTAAVKQKFADELADYAVNRYRQLPPCTLRQPPTSTDPLQINCQIPGYNIDQHIADFKAKVVSNQEFLPKPFFTADTTVKDDHGTEQPVATYSTAIPQRYHQAKLARWLIPILLIGLGVAVVYLSDSKLAGLKRLGISLLVVGIMSAAALWIGYVVISSLKGRIPVSIAEEGLRDALLRLFDLARQDYTRTAGVIAGIYIVLGLGLTGGVYFRTRDKASKEKPRPRYLLNLAPPPSSGRKRRDTLAREKLQSCSEYHSCARLCFAHSTAYIELKLAAPWVRIASH